MCYNTIVSLFTMPLFLQLSLFFDILLCMTADIEEEEFISGGSRASPGQQPPSGVMRRAREHLWNTLSGTKMKAGRWVYDHLDTFSFHKKRIGHLCSSMNNFCLPNNSYP